jgi:hypothetical protein
MKIIWFVLALPSLALAEGEETFVPPPAPVILVGSEVDSEDLETTPAVALETAPTPAPVPGSATLATPEEAPALAEAPAAPALPPSSSVPADEEEEAVAEATAPPLKPEPPLGPTAEEGYGSIEMKNEPAIFDVNRVTASEPEPSSSDL